MVVIVADKAINTGSNI